MRKITEENIDSVKPEECIYAIFINSRIGRLGEFAAGWGFTSQYASHGCVGYYGHKEHRGSIAAAVCRDHRVVHEFDTEAEYHQWSLEQLTGKTWFPVNKISESVSTRIHVKGDNRPEGQKPRCAITTTDANWMEEARQLAAQCWCDKETEGRVMDAVLAEAVAKRIALWMDTAAQNQQNADYYRELVVRCGKAIGEESYIQDDGNRADEVLCAKVPELVESMCENTRTR